MTTTPSGRRLGGKRSPHKPGEAHFVPPLGLLVNYQLRQELRGASSPKVWDQGQEGSCEAHGWGASLAWAFGMMPSRQMMYNAARIREGALGVDDGCYSTDMLGVCEAGVYDEAVFPYDPLHMFATPPVGSPLYRLSGASRITIVDGICAALDNGLPLPFTITLPDYFDGLEVGNHGVLRTPRPGFTQIGEHCMAVVGAIRNFWESPEFAMSGLATTEVSNEVGICRNSWGPEFGDKGHVYIDLAYILGPWGNDIWVPYKGTVTAQVGNVAVHGTFQDTGVSI